MKSTDARMKCSMHISYTERKKWSQNGSRVEPFSCPQDGPHLGTVLVPVCKVAPFSTKKRLIMAPLPKVGPFQLHCGAVLANGTTLVSGTFFFSNLIINEKNGSTFIKWSQLPKRPKTAPGWSHFSSTFFSQCSLYDTMKFWCQSDEWLKSCLH